MIKALILVGLGGGAGSILRYLASAVVTKYVHTLFPLATFLVNISGCLLIGLLSALLSRQPVANPDLRWLFLTGFCGGYTTFSTFSAENIQLFQSGHAWMAVWYTMASVLAGLLAVWVGTKAW
ncbi:MAG: fluoride efflux transporter CrcB [Tannerellaceae bacterium]|jgi:CrcB protein|nr:fluoride efflux transporter CrcB [Tannerellaceae bacterium]